MKRITEHYFINNHLFGQKLVINHRRNIATGANVKKSILANGCVIDGDVEGSILFRGVSVEAGATIKNSIIMQRCTIEAGVYLENVILDKDVHVTANQKLIGSKEKPYVVAKSKVFVIDVS